MIPRRPNGLALLLALSALGQAGCDREVATETAAADAPPVSAADRAAADAQAEVGIEAAATAIAQVSGTFAGTLPCADCAGIETTLRLHADGGYDLIERRAGEAEADTHHGVWFVSDDGRAILIASDADAGDHHIFEWQGDDALRLLAPAADRAGAGESAHLLRRTE
ncbi:copper resistance protein NlpE N-terminal domain-containing protein [Luteimonas huabeiensis]|uniref:copper resistance protein NlpE N-terminal domain-containing protein n=1 Tax=Luteimonas huabeiensis TaxID=1244513 RepID=UPI0004677495|nr:copper resistance protein NlpE N-terminal domain-containing protein [Luteimonas huabeiensis]